MATKMKVTDNTRKALKKISKMSAKTIVDFGEKVVEIASDAVHRITGNLAESILVEEKKEGQIRVVTTTGYGIHEETRPGHEFIKPAIPKAINDFQKQGKWDKA